MLFALQTAELRAISCYSRNNTLVYNPQAESATIFLQPSGNSECEDLPRSIEATLLADGVMERRIVYKFDYKTVQEIHFENVLANISYGISHFYFRGYSYEVSINIANIIQEELTLDSCFTNMSSIVFDAGGAVIKLQPTGLCLNIFKQSTPLTATLVVSGFAVALDASIIVRDYTLDEVVLEVSGDFSIIQDQAFEQGKIVFSIDNIHEFYLELLRIEVSGFGTVNTPNGDFRLFDRDKLGFLKINHMFVIRIEVSAAFDLFQPVFAGNPFTSYMYRLTIRTPGNELQLEKTYYRSVFNSNIKYLTFTCDMKDPQKRRICLESYGEVGQNSAITLDLMLLNSTSVVLVEKLVLPVFLTCWKIARMIHRNSMVCVAIQCDEEHSCNKYFPIPVGSMVELELIQNYTMLTSITDTTKEVFIQHKLEYCQPVADHGEHEGNLSIFFSFLTPSGEKLHMFTNSMLNGNYEPMQIAAYVVGGLFLIACIANTVFGLVDAIRTVLHVRKYIT